jgi:hypothetical protein
MGQIIKKENITIVIREYTDNQGQQKKVYKTIGELVTMQGDNGLYQFGELWGPTGSTKFKVFDQSERQQTGQQTGQSQGGYQQQGQQQQGGGFNQSGQGGGFNQPNNGFCILGCNN